MPVQLPTTYGKTDYAVVKALRDLGSAINALEQRQISTDVDSKIQALQASVATLQRQVATLNQQVQGLLHP